MGNTTSTQKPDKEFDHFYDVIDYIATYYILTMDFKSLKELSKTEYCDKLIVLTSEIINKYFTDLEVEYISQRTENKVEINKKEKQPFIFINKDRLDSLDVSNDFQKNTKKTRVCLGIAKFYVKIAHIFAAIVTTMNPVYTYKDAATGNTVKTDFLNKDKIPKGTDRKLEKLSICDNRIRALQKGEIIDETIKKTTLQPKICAMNLKKDKSGIKTLEDEPGIPEFMNLYYDKYDYAKGTFTGMTDNTKVVFQEQLELFYTAFTGKKMTPEDRKTITKFSDIKLKDYNKEPLCQTSDIFRSGCRADSNSKLLINYATHIKNMIQRATDNQSKLLKIINQLFTYVKDPFSGKRVIRINPELTEETLQKIVEQTRVLIMNLYITCEKDYVEGVKLYEAIVEAKICETTQKQIATLEKYSANTISEMKMQPEMQPEMMLNPEMKMQPTESIVNKEMPLSYSNIEKTQIPSQ